MTPNRGTQEHPEGYDGPCECDECMMYAADVAEPPTAADWAESRREERSK